MKLTTAEKGNTTSCVRKVETHVRPITAKVNQGDTVVDLVKIEASKLTRDDNVFDCDNKHSKVGKLIFRAKIAIENGVKDFWVPRCAPSFNEDETGLCFKPGSPIAVNKSYNWFEEAARAIDPARRTRIITENEYYVFLVVLVKNLIESGWKKAAAWEAVCVNSSPLGNYWDSKDTPHKMEPTGSREVCGICDLGNAYKMIASKRDGGFHIVGGHFGSKGVYWPLCDMNYERRVNMPFRNSRPFVVYEVA